MNITCPICSSGESSIRYSQMPQFPGARIVQCQRCSHIYTLIENDIDTESLYTDQDEVYKVVENRNSIFDKILNVEYGSVIKKLNSTNSSGKLLLDFGSGKGKFASLAQQNGWKVKCVETSPDRAEYARRTYQLDVKSEFYSSGKIFTTDFDVITLFHVVEHLPKPAELLSALIRDNLKPGGMVVIEVPNFRSLQSGFVKNKWIHLDVPRHLNHFSPERLRLLIMDCEMIPVKTTYFSFHLGVLGMVDSLMKVFGYTGNVIYQLKNRKSLKLILGILCLLPFALILETVGSAMGKGGIVRMYCRKR